MRGLDLRVWELIAGKGFALNLDLHEGINQPLDICLFVTAKGGYHTISLNGRVKSGIEKLCSNIPGYSDVPFTTLIKPAVGIPPARVGETVTFHALVREAGKIPPIGGDPSRLIPITPHVVLRDGEELHIK